MLFDLVHAGLAGASVALLAPGPNGLGEVLVRSEQLLGFGLLAAGATMFLVILLNLRRGRTWAWVCQLVLLCLIVGVAPFPGLIWVPLLIAWCGPAVRDWFDPPLSREF
jgi:hypothetical protein